MISSIPQHAKIAVKNIGKKKQRLKKKERIQDNKTNLAVPASGLLMKAHQEVEGARATPDFDEGIHGGPDFDREVLQEKVDKVAAKNMDGLCEPYWTAHCMLS